MSAGNPLRPLAAPVRSALHVHGLQLARSARRPFARILSAADRKRMARIEAVAALAEGYRVDRIEGDDGLELLIATRGAETLRFANLAEAEHWLDSMIAQRTGAAAWACHDIQDDCRA
jgi:hypothetical protein